MKIINRIKVCLYDIYGTAKKVAKGKVDLVAIALDYVYCKLRFDVTSDEYLKYGFYNFSDRYRKQFLLVNHKKLFRNVNTRFFTASKYIFYKRIPDLFEREMILAPQCGEKNFVEFFKKHQRIIIKPDDGSLGRGIELIDFTGEDAAKEQFAKFTEAAPYICEEIIKQHSDLQSFNPFSVNTIRIVSLLKDGEVEIVSGTLRAGAKAQCIVDNLMSGGIGAQIDVETGIVDTFGFDYAFNRYAKHPLTGTQIIGFRIPNWELAVARVIEAHKRLPQCLLFGWDIAITQDSVDIVEANIAPGPRIMQVEHCKPKGQSILPVIKKNILKQDKSKKLQFAPDYSVYFKETE